MVAGQPQTQRRSGLGWQPEPWLLLSPATALRFRAQAVNAVISEQLAGQPAVRPSVHSGEQVLVRGAIGGSAAFATLESVAKQLGLRAHIDREDREIAEAVAALDLPGLSPSEVVTRVCLVPMGGKPAKPCEPWLVVQSCRSTQGSPTGDSAVAVDHLVALHEHVNGSPFVVGLEHVNGSPVIGGLEHVNGSPYGVGNSVLSPYGTPGFGGRFPATWAGRPPHREVALTRRRPVVAVLDTGVGKHSWLGEDVVRRKVVVGKFQLDRVSSRDSAGVSPMTGELDEDTGHGTFIAGIIRQTCPDADVVSARVMDDSGVVAESDLINALYLLLIRQVTALRTGDVGALIDVITLSLGYYHEQPGDETLDPMLLAPITALGRHGVVVVASAGNDATQRPVYPAAFTPHRGGPVSTPDRDVVPVVSVGACNPDGTIALFSNGGRWVNAYRAGAAMVSTMPENLNAGVAASVITHGPGGYLRETIDPDDFKSGFGTWSGTSFAVPVMAGQILQQLINGEQLESSNSRGNPISKAGAVKRGWAAVAKSLADDVHPLKRP